MKLPNFANADGLHRTCRNMGLTIHRSYGENTQVISDLYEVSNTRKLGVTEREICDLLLSGIRVIIANEEGKS